MTRLGILLIIFSAACGGSLSDEQRKEMREKMEASKIVRVTDLEITEAAFEEGRQLTKLIDQIGGDSARLDSLLTAQNGKIRLLTPGASDAKLLEQQLIDAYLADESGLQQDNIQKLRDAGGDYDSILYTKPVTIKAEDGSDRLVGVWNIWLLRKDLVIKIGNKK